MTITTHIGDSREILSQLPAESVQAICTSPPYYALRRYTDGDAREIGGEETPDAYISALVEVFRAARRVLRPDGVLWLNLGDSYAADDKWGGASGGKNYTSADDAGAFRRERRSTGLKTKDLIGIPWAVAFALRADGWYLRSALPWMKRNAMPESVRDRPTVAHEYVFLLTKAERYYYDADAVRMDSSESSLARAHLNATAKPPPRSYALVESGDHAGVLSRAKAYGQGRNYRTSDPWFASLDQEIEAARAHLAQLEAVKARGGLLLDPEGDPLALPVNPRPYRGAHFAVWPETLVEPLIRVSSAAQACGACGAPWRRVVEVKSHSIPVAERQGRYTHEGRVPQQSGYFWAPPEREERGWEPTCAHGDGAGRSVILDPFAGSGTTLRVAERLGRDSIGIDLHAGYEPLQRERTNGVQVELFT